jgi:hypothetical protein
VAVQCWQLAKTAEIRRLADACVEHFLEHPSLVRVDCPNWDHSETLETGRAAWMIVCWSLSGLQNGITCVVWEMVWASHSRSSSTHIFCMKLRAPGHPTRIDSSGVDKLCKQHCVARRPSLASLLETVGARSAGTRATMHSRYGDIHWDDIKVSENKSSIRKIMRKGSLWLHR